jgi:tight adherence protein C
MSELMAGDGLGTILAIVAAVAGASLFACAGLLVVDRVSLRSQLRGIDELYKLVDVRDQELMLPFTDRVASPALGLLARLGHRFSPAGRVEEMRIMLRRAGRPDVDTDRYLAIRVLSILAAPFVAYAAWTFAAGFGGLLRLACTAVGVACCTVLPSRRLRAQVEKREASILRELPDIMDLLVICMEAGLGFTAAVSRAVAHIEGELSDEFAMVLAEMRVGSSRSDALLGLAERVQIPELRSFVTAIRQADQFGVAVSTVLRDQAEDMRISRRQAAQEKAMKAPVKMLIPMVFCIFPPMFIIVISPAALSISGSGAL